jgi:hypothetical protein
MSDAQQGPGGPTSVGDGGYPVAPPLAPQAPPADLGATPSPQVGFPPPPPHSPPPPPPSAGGGGIPATVALLGVLVVVVLMVAVGVVVAGDDDGGGSGGERATGSESPTTTGRGPVTTTDRGEEPGSSSGEVEPPSYDEEESPPSNGGDVVADADRQGFRQYETDYDDGPLVSYGVILENTADSVARHLELRISFLDDAGTVVGTDDAYVTAIPPGESLGIGGEMVEVTGEAAEMQVTADVTQWAAPDDYGTITVDNIEVNESEYDTSVVFDAESTYPYDLMSTEVYAIFHDADGAIVGGAQDFGLFLRSGSSSSGQISLFDTVPDVDLDATEVYVDPGLM